VSGHPGLPEGWYEVTEGVIVRPMLTISDAIDLFDGDCARRGLTDKTRATYRGILYELAEQFPARWDVAKLSTDDVDRFLAQRGKKHARGTRAHAECVLNSFFRCLYRQEKIKRNPIDRLQRTRRLPPDALDVTTVSSAEVLRLFQAAETWAERLCVHILAYTGPRRRAAARLRLVDYDQLRGRLRFQEKGGKVIWKPIPDPLKTLVDAAIAAGVIV
jgi:integrase